LARIKRDPNAFGRGDPHAFGLLTRHIGASDGTFQGARPRRPTIEGAMKTARIGRVNHAARRMHLQNAVADACGAGYFGPTLATIAGFVERRVFFRLAPVGFVIPDARPVDHARAPSFGVVGSRIEGELFAVVVRTGDLSAQNLPPRRRAIFG